MQIRDLLLYLFTAFCLTYAEQLESPLVLMDPIVERSLSWLSQQHQADFGFKDQTPLAVIALHLSNSSGWYHPDNLISQLIVKQMDVEILQKLARHHDTPIVPAEIALYSLALSAMCRDPQKFYDMNLIGTLTRHELLLDMEFSISSLAICASNSHVRKRQLRRLLDITEAKDVPNSGPSKILGKQQKANGSFGSLKTSAWVIQALEATDPTAQYWNKTAAVAYLKSAQQEDGSFGDEKDVSTTAAVLLALGPRSLANIKDLNCYPDRSEDWQTILSEYSSSINLSASDHNLLAISKPTEERDPSFNLSTETVSTKKGNIQNIEGLATVSYTLWVGTNVSSVHSVNISTEPNSTFYHVMQLAAQKDSNFSFQATEWPNGHYIHTIGENKEEPMTYQYWLLYKLPSEPQISSPPTNQYVAPVGADDLLISDGEFYLFWYKKL